MSSNGSPICASASSSRVRSGCRRGCARWRPRSTRSLATRNGCRTCRCDRATTCAGRSASRPIPTEDVGWIIEQAGPEVCLFSSDYPHVEGGRRPIERFEASLANTSAAARQAFYHDNFVDVMGAGLGAATELARRRRDLSRYRHRNSTHGGLPDLTKSRSDRRAGIGRRNRERRLGRRCCTTRTCRATGNRSRCTRRDDRAAVSNSAICSSIRGSHRVDRLVPVVAGRCAARRQASSARRATSSSDRPIRWATRMNATRRSASDRYRR